MKRVSLLLRFKVSTIFGEQGRCLRDKPSGIRRNQEKRQPCSSNGFGLILYMQRAAFQAVAADPQVYEECNECLHCLAKWFTSPRPAPPPNWARRCNSAQGLDGYPKKKHSR